MSYLNVFNDCKIFVQRKGKNCLYYYYQVFYHNSESQIFDTDVNPDLWKTEKLKKVYTVV